jgi:energy-coupling factor transporter ATP-binding protein EcfA2
MQTETTHSPTAAPAPAMLASGRHSDLNELPDVFLVELLLRHFFRLGELPLFQISQRLGLARQRAEALLRQMRDLHLVEVPRRGEFEGDVSYALTESGQLQAKLAFEKCQYVGPAPVTLHEYASKVREQSTHLQPTSAQQLKAAVGDLVIDEALLPSLGSALNSGKAIYFYGPSGSGKTYLAEHLVKTLQGHIWVPHAIYVDGEVIQVFDPRVHRVVEPSEVPERSLSRHAPQDARWVCTERPVVITGGELTLQMLELEFDTLSRLYVAPAQMKANNGIFVVDDLGRQRISPRELLNRWIVPLDRHVDYLGLHTGGKLKVPFDVTVIFLSNLAPEELTDPAFSRRLGYKFLIGEISKEGYREVVAQACRRVGVAFNAEAADYLVDHLHPSCGQPYLPCVPYDVISKIRDRALYMGEPAHLSPALLTWAWKLYFGTGDSVPQAADQSKKMEEYQK